MSRRLPLCAACGGSLRDGEREGRARLTVQYRAIPGMPTIGWHDGCAAPDDIAALPRPKRQSVEAMLREISSRGPGRVVAGKAWK